MIGVGFRAPAVCIKEKRAKCMLPFYALAKSIMQVDLAAECEGTQFQSLYFFAFITIYNVPKLCEGVRAFVFVNVFVNVHVREACTSRNRPQALARTCTVPMPEKGSSPWSCCPQYRAA